jgi:hypothetical protein
MLGYGIGRRVGSTIRGWGISVQKAVLFSGDLSGYSKSVVGYSRPSVDMFLEV